MKTNKKWLRAYVAQLLGEIWSNPHVVTDGDGDWPFRSDYGAAWVRVETCCEPWTVHVFAHAVHSLPGSAKVKDEVHDLNARARFVKVMWAGGLVVVKASLPASTLDRRTLKDAMDQVTSVVDEIGPVFAAVHGGETPYAPEGVDRAG